MAMTRVSGVQMPVLQKEPENLARIIEYIRTTDADFIVFPEMALTGYRPDFSDEKTEDAWEQIATACRQAYTAALVGTGAKTPEGVFVQARVFGSDGSLVGTQEKLIPTMDEREWCRPGEELRMFDHEGLTFGCLAGNDLWVTPGFGPYPDPRLSHQLAQRGADAIFVLANTGSETIYAPYHESNLVLRAMEAGVPLIVVNASSSEGPVNCPSGVIGPDGVWRVEAPREGEHAFHYEFEPGIET